MEVDLSRHRQVPKLLDRLDDPWGISWRVVNLLRRFDARWTLRFVCHGLRSRPHRQPIFILGAPRSGTTFLFHLLRTSSALGSLPGEGHNVWRAFHHPRSSGWTSDTVGAGAVKFGERRFVDAYFRAWIGSRRMVEKTPENSLRIPYLLDLFPDAHFVVIHRHPLDVIHSLIEAWRHPQGRYRSYYLPEDLHIPGHAHRRRWCFALFEGWRDYRRATVPEIALAQWEACARGLVAGRSLAEGFQERWTEIHFEDLLSHPQATAARLYARLGLNDEPRLEHKLRELIERPVNALSPPEEQKWRRNAEEIVPLVPRVVELARELGYRIDSASGRCEREVGRFCNGENNQRDVQDGETDGSETRCSEISGNETSGSKIKPGIVES
jgi:hypothetical protein